MILDPKVIFKKGIIQNVKSPGEQIQQNGIDLTVRKVFVSLKTVDFNEPKGRQGQLAPLKPDWAGWQLKALTPYNLVFNEKVNIPSGMAAAIFIRSSFNRKGIFGNSGWYDTGFSDYVGSTLYPFVNCIIPVNYRVAQIIFFKSKGRGMYNGFWKNFIESKN